MSLEKIKVWGLLILALVLFIPLFLTGGVAGFDFWSWMAFNAIFLVGSSFLLDRKYLKILADDRKDNPLFKVILGLLSAVFLYVVFAAGNYLAGFLPFAKSGIHNVYGLKQGASLIRIVLLLVFIVGPGEELLWRGYFQRVFGSIYGVIVGFVIATAFYVLMHMGSLNIMLVAAAGVCGIFWGYLYMKYQSVLLNVISHTAWDLAVFILFPFK